MIEGRLWHCEGDLGQALEELLLISVLLLNEGTLFTLNLVLRGRSDLQSLSDSEEGFPSHLKGNIGKEPPLALVLHEASLAFSLIK